MDVLHITEMYTLKWLILCYAYCQLRVKRKKKSYGARCLCVSFLAPQITWSLTAQVPALFTSCLYNYSHPVSSLDSAF